jgi:hypothetical protein
VKPLELFLLIALTPVAVWVLARVSCAAYFAAKAAYLRRFFHESDQTKAGRDSSP